VSENHFNSTYPLLHYSTTTAMLSGRKRALAKMSTTATTATTSRKTSSVSECVSECVSDSGSGLFTGSSVLLTCMPTSRVKIFSSIITSHGGRVVPWGKKNHSLPHSLTPSLVRNLDGLVTHIVVEKHITTEALSQKLQCSSIPSSVSVVVCTWIEQSVLQKKCLATEEFNALIATCTHISNSDEWKSSDEKVCVHSSEWQSNDEKVCVPEQQSLKVKSNASCE
jgi:hypothetical protein